MITKIVGFVAKHAGKERSSGVRMASLAAGSIMFMIIFPVVLWFPAHFVSMKCSIMIPNFIEMSLGIIAIIPGLFILLWSVYSFWFVGGGTPLPFASPTRLVTDGPFRYTRNPIKLGAILLYFGIGAIIDTILTGIVLLIIAGTLGTIYHKVIEEKELLIRFGSEYEEYRRRTSFLIPLPPKIS